MVTAETLTDEEIREYGAGNFYEFIVARDAMQYHETLEPYSSIRRDARARIVAAINARKGK